MLVEPADEFGKAADIDGVGDGIDRLAGQCVDGGEYGYGAGVIVELEQHAFGTVEPEADDGHGDQRDAQREELAIVEAGRTGDEAAAGKDQRHESRDQHAEARGERDGEEGTVDKQDRRHRQGQLQCGAQELEQRIGRVPLLHLQQREPEPVDRAGGKVRTDRNGEFQPALGDDQYRRKRRDGKSERRRHQQHARRQHDAAAADLALPAEAKQRDAQPVADGGIGELADGDHEGQQAILGLVDHARRDDQQQQCREARQQDRRGVDQGRA